MNSSIPEAKKRLIANIGTNILAVIVGVAIGIWQTPYLIRHFGIEVYGMIPLVISFIAYFNLLTTSITNAVTRFVAVHLSKDEEEQGNIYFNSALFALAILCGILLIPVIILSVFFSKVFQVPAGFESDTNLMFFCVILSSFCFAISSSFRVSTFVTHRFDINNYITISSKLVRIVVLILCFSFLSPSLRYFGISYFVMAFYFLAGFILLTKMLTPQLKISRTFFRWSTVREMSKMSGWIMVNEIGALLYFSASFILINLFLGSEQVARFGVIAQLPMFIVLLGGAISNVFAPIAYDYIANKNVEILVFQMRRSIKFITLLMAFPIGLVCGLAKPLLILWLGEAFSDLDLLVWLLVGPWIINVSVRPMFSIFRGLDRIKIPALATIVIGVVNIVICIILMKYAGLGIYGVAYSLLLCLAGKNLFFTPIYAAIITGCPKAIFIKELISGIVMWLLLSFGIFIISLDYDLVSIPRLMTVVVISFMIYFTFCYLAILTKDDKRLLLSLVYKRN
jgi:membrane protein EpsK